MHFKIFRIKIVFSRKSFNIFGYFENIRTFFKHIHTKGYRGVMGMEHGNAQPGKEGELALIKAYRDADSFV